MQDGTERPCDEPFHLLAPHICRLKHVPTSKRAGAGAIGAEGGAAGAGGAGAGAAAAAPAAVVPEVPAADVTILGGHVSEVFTCAFHPTRADLLATG